MAFSKELPEVYTNALLQALRDEYAQELRAARSFYFKESSPTKNYYDVYSHVCAHKFYYKLGGLCFDEILSKKLEAEAMLANMGAIKSVRYGEVKVVFSTEEDDADWEYDYLPSVCIVCNVVRRKKLKDLRKDFKGEIKSAGFVLNCQPATRKAQVFRSQINKYLPDGAEALTEETFINN